MKALLATALVCMAVLAGCGGATPAEERTTPQEARERPPAEPDAVELTLRTAAGPLMFVGDLRGHPVLLFMFASFDALSQAAMTPLERFAQAHPDVHVVGVALEPDAERLVRHFARTLQPPYPVTYDPEDALERGETPIGKIQAVPSFVMLDALGRPVVQHLGFAKVEELERMLEMAEDAVDPDRAAQELSKPPLIGNPRR